MVKNMVKDSSMTDSAKTLNARLNARTHEMVVGQWLMDIQEIGAVGAVGAVDIRPRLL
jgi:hypothetical protein